ncbi:cuticle collagen 39-like [Penaeus monodon]|uniref:cuticle collagen 39-like n=1 Tax=Penaeus monodon TaxID=6687 RepID=UPI0018A7DB45|nr:cuticle collagen 39-like [Penaeus monodon]
MYDGCGFTVSRGFEVAEDLGNKGPHTRSSQEQPPTHVPRAFSPARRSKPSKGSSSPLSPRLAPVLIAAWGNPLFFFTMAPGVPPGHVGHRGSDPRPGGKGAVAQPNYLAQPTPGKQGEFTGPPPAPFPAAHKPVTPKVSWGSGKSHRGPKYLGPTRGFSAPVSNVRRHGGFPSIGPPNRIVLVRRPGEPRTGLWPGGHGGGEQWPQAPLSFPQGAPNSRPPPAPPAGPQGVPGTFDCSCWSRKT